MGSKYYFFRNLLLLALVGVLVSAWILYYTDYGEQLIGLLGLGGLFSWLAFVSRVLPDDRLKELQGWVDEGFLSKSAVSYGLLVTLTLAAVFGTFQSSVEVVSHENNISRTIQIAPIGDSTDTETLAAGARIRKTFWTRYFASRQIRVKVSGYPDKQLLLHPWHRQTLYVSNSFLRPVILLVPDTGLHERIRNDPKRIFITITNGKSAKDYGPLPYSGEALWLGCDEDVLVPDRLQNQWRAELASQSRNVLLYDLVYPRAVTGGPSELIPGSRVEVRVRFLTSEQEVGRADATVQSLQTFPQEVKIIEVQN